MNGSANMEITPQSNFHIINSPYSDEDVAFSYISIHRGDPAPTSHKLNSTLQIIRNVTALQLGRFLRYGSELLRAFNTDYPKDYLIIDPLGRKILDNKKDLLRSCCCCCCGLLFNDRHLLQLTSETIAVRRLMIYGFDGICGPYDNRGRMWPTFLDI